MNFGKVAIVMGSKSDLEVVKPTVKILKRFGVEAVVRVMSAHRTPEAAHKFAVNADKEGFDVLIGVAGKAAHLSGVLAGNTVLPVIGIPVKTSDLGGMDSLLSTVQMPSGVPVATVAINGGENAGILAVQILAGKFPSFKKMLYDYKNEMKDKITADDKSIAAEIESL